MDLKGGANPFLFNEEETSPNSSNSNPFLINDETEDFTNENPFLTSQTATITSVTMPPSAALVTSAIPTFPSNSINSSNSTNPFAFDPIDDTPEIIQNQNIFSNSTNVFTQDFLSDTTITVTTTQIPLKPTDLDLKYINTESNVQSTKPPKETQDLLMSVMGEMDATSSHLLDKIPPTRTPSPVSMRDLHSPSPTPEPFGDLLDVSDEKMEEKSTNDLLMLDENDDVNQNHQMIQSNMMPSNMVQTNMVETNLIPSNIIQTNAVQTNMTQTNVVSANVIQPNIPTKVAAENEIAPKVVPLKPTPPQRPCPPARPPRPALPPQKPPPPIFSQKQPAQQNVQPPIQQNIQQPLQQNIQQPLQQNIQQPLQQNIQQPLQQNIQQPLQQNIQQPLQQNIQQPLQQNIQQQIIQNSPFQVQQEPISDDILMFGDNIPSKPVTTQDILSLYNKPIEKQEITDLLCDNFEETTPKSSLENIQNDKTPQPLVQDTFLSPDPSHSDNQMDTSDSQSKGSASSVTFNPFAVQENAPLSNATKTQSDEMYQEDVHMEEDVEEIKEEIKEPDFVVQSEIIEPIQNIFSMEPSESNIFNDVVQDQEMYQNDFTKPEVMKNIEINNREMKSFNATEIKMQSQSYQQDVFEKQDAFDAFAAKFESAAAQDENKNGGFVDAFGGGAGNGGSTWGDTQVSDAFNDSSSGFGPDESFDAFLAMKEPPAPQSTPNRFTHSGSLDSDEEKDFSVVIRPKNDDVFVDSVLPTIAPPTIPMVAADSSPRFNPFDLSEQAQTALPHEPAVPFEEAAFQRTDSQETPPTPLFDEDVSQPLEPFPRMEFTEDGWEIQLRQPNKKKITGQRFWRKMWLRVYQTGETSYLQLFNNKDDKNPVQELPLQPCYSVSDIGAQQYDTFGKIFTVKIQYIFYKERPGIRPGQVKKAERITNKLSQFAAYAIQGDYQGVKEFGSDLKKLGLPVEHAPQVSQLMKLGSLSYEDLKRFSFAMEEALFKMDAHRDRALQFKMEEVQITAVDELYVEQDAEGHVEKQIARVRLFFLGFLTGMPDIELGINDMRRQGKEVVGRHDIIPVATEEWIRLEAVEFHSCVQQDEYEKSHIIKFQPPDACYIELMRFRIRPPKNRELPLQLKPTICISGNKVELRADVLVPGFASRKLGQVPCEDVMIRFPIPECWIYLFRVEKHFRYGSVKSTHRRTGKVKGIERILGTVDTLQESLIEVTSGQAKYEHQHRAIVWRCPRLPKEGQGAYTTHNMVCRLALTSYDQMPEKLAEYCYVEFTMPATQVSHTTVRSVSLQNSDSDEPPEKYVRYLARHEYRVGIEHTEGQGPAAYEVATSVTPKTPAPIPEQVPNAAESSTDSD